MTIHQYVENEDGPECTCGMPTVVKMVDGGAGALCLFHTAEAGAFFRLPEMTEKNWERCKAGDVWPVLEEEDA